MDIDSNAAFQDAYVNALFSAAENLDAEFIVWFSLADFDALWNGVLLQDPVARIWRDIGLYDDALNPRPAMDTWMNQLSLPLD